LGRLGNRNFLTNNFSNILDNIGVTEIGRKSPKSRGGVTLGIGVTMLNFHESGEVEVVKIMLYI
jgi:hypothetical protein